MELFNEIFAQALMGGDIQLILRGRNGDISKIIEEKCYQALQKIRAIVNDDSLDDKECFMRIEEIVCALEEIGCRTNRHDFG